MLEDRNWDEELRDLTHMIRFTRNEFLLIDWVLCTGSGLLLSDDFMAYTDDRISIWECVDIEGPQHGVLWPLTESMGHILLAIVPTTFTWGDGVDCGYTLKKKISQFLRGEYIDPQIQQDKDDEEAREVAETQRRKGEYADVLVKKYGVDRNALMLVDDMEQTALEIVHAKKLEKRRARYAAKKKEDPDANDISDQTETTGEPAT